MFQAKHISERLKSKNAYRNKSKKETKCFITCQTLGIISFKIRHVWEYFRQNCMCDEKNCFLCFQPARMPFISSWRKASRRRQTRERVAKPRELKGNPCGKKTIKDRRKCSFLSGPSLSLTRNYTMVYRRKESIPNGLAAVSLFSVHRLDVTLERFM